MVDLAIRYIYFRIYYSLAVLSISFLMDCNLKFLVMHNVNVTSRMAYESF